ncbi:hypothetical protein ACJMK2_037694, partial [Sinanodonta woodiana]
MFNEFTSMYLELIEKFQNASRKFGNDGIGLQSHCMMLSNQILNYNIYQVMQRREIFSDDTDDTSPSKDTDNTKWTNLISEKSTTLEKSIRKKTLQ